MSIKDLEKITAELGEINENYRKTFAISARLDMIERVRKLLALIETEEGAKFQDAPFPI